MAKRRVRLIGVPLDLGAGRRVVSAEFVETNPILDHPYLRE